MHDAQKALHPFFSKPTAPQKQEIDDSSRQSEIQQLPLAAPAAPAAPIQSEVTATPIDKSSESRPLYSILDQPSEPTPPKRARGRGRPKAKTSPSSKKKAATKVEPDEESVESQSDARKKRRRLSQDGAGGLLVEVQVPASSPQDKDVEMGGVGSEDMIVPQSSPGQLPSSQPEPVTQSNVSASLAQHVDQPTQLRPASQHSDTIPTLPGQPVDKRSKSPPKKMLQLKAGGRLASPVKPEPPQVVPVEEEPQIKKPAKRGRKKKEKHLVAVCRYTAEGGIGGRIDLIMNNEERFDLPRTSKARRVTVKPPPRKPNLARPDPSKPTHPFFSGKPKPPPTTNKPTSASNDLTESPRRTSAVTPGKLRAQRQMQRAEDEDCTPVQPPFGNSRDRMISKQPGMRHAPWPSKGLSHIRGDDSHIDILESRRPAGVMSLPVAAGVSRKMKHRVAILHPDHNLLHDYCRTLDFNQDGPVRPDGFRDPSPSLRVPTRSLISGSKIQDLVYTQLDEFSTMHPACVHLYDSTPSAMTAYDKGRSEIQAWAQKYAPTCAEDVLQPGKEAYILRDWMKTLTVMAVNGFAAQVAKADKPEQKPKKKRRKRPADIDDFIVNSDEDVNNLDELAELDDAPSSQGSVLQRRSLVQQSATAKLSNAILISGPSGSGKSAMAYAVAKELGFEVFEINSGSRRSGKDVLDRVGDMVENHLVQRHAADTGNTSADEDAGRLSEAFKADLASGRQGTMAGFFSSKLKKVNAVPKQQSKPESAQQMVQQTVGKAKSARSQKQSVILLEEVDILFEEDKGFWQTVFTLIINSKRPVIMTCNDEDLVPIQAMTLHAILRLSPAPSAMATDYMLLVAAKEGHMLDREAISTLYDSKGQDLRASIADLQLWCQMGVGDPRGGLGWIYQRWPSGTGIDKDGLPIRVTSQGTYQAGMGSLLYTPESSTSHNSKEELLLQLWEDWGVDPRVRLFDRAERKMQQDRVYTDSHDKLRALRDHERFSDTMSAMDMYSSVGLPDSTHYDITDPPISDKSRTSYIAGLALLQTPSMVDYSCMETRLAVTTTQLASQVYSLPLDTSSSAIISDITSPEPHMPLTRAAFAPALEPLAYNPLMSSLGSSLSYTMLDGPFRAIVMDIAPYVRSIAAFDLALEAQRASMGGSQGPAPKKIRTTRAARSALEGGQRSLTRRERWFSGLDLDLGLVLGTAGEWPRLGGGEVADLDTKMEDLTSQ